MCNRSRKRQSFYEQTADIQVSEWHNYLPADVLLRHPSNDPAFFIYNAERHLFLVIKAVRVGGVSAVMYIC